MQASLSAAPEAPLDLVARGDFSKLSLPILVAAGSARDIESFRDRHGLLQLEVKRYCEPMPSVHADKVLILLPGWEDHRPTYKAVLHWVRSDRWTVEMDEVREPSKRSRLSPNDRAAVMAASVVICAFAFAGVLGWSLGEFLKWLTTYLLAR